MEVVRTKIFEAIEICDRQKPNGYEREDKIHWLDQLDRRIFRELVATHEGGRETFGGYTPYTDDDTELLADEAYAELYVKWLFAQIDFANAEMQRYNNSVTMFNTLYNAYADWYNREHMPKQPNWVKGARK